MPCDQVITIQAGELLKLHRGTLQRAIKKTGYEWAVDLDTGEVRGSDPQAILRAVKRTYAELVVEDQTRRFGWTIKRKLANKFTLTRRA